MHVLYTPASRCTFRPGQLFRAALAVMVLFGLAGCAVTTVQKAAATRFSAAASVLSAAAAEEFRTTRADAISMNKARRRLGDTTVDPARFDVLFDAPAIEARVAAAEALGRYAQLLSGLMNGSPAAELAASGDTLVASLTRLNAAQDLNLSDAQLGAIGSAVQLAGGAATDAMRLRAARRISEQARPAVRAIAEKIRRDFTVGLANPDGTPVVNLADQFIRGTARNLDRAVNTPLPLNGVVASADEIDAARVLAAEKQARFRAVASKIVEAAAKVDNAQNELERVLADPSFTLDDIDAFVTRAEELSRTLKILSGK